MLGKLLKHEFRATGRIMLPVYGAMLVLALLANLSIRLLDRGISSFLQIFAVLTIVVFFIAIIGAGILTIVLIVRRFYSNYLKNEGYLMHTLPVNVHGLVWSKIIVASVLFIATFLVIFLIIGGTALFQSGTGLASFFSEFPSWKEIMTVLKEEGFRGIDITMYIVYALLSVLLSCVTTCLHFYAALSLGHMFSKDKILMSIVFFIGLSILFSVAGTGYGFIRLQALQHPLGSLEELTQKLNMVHQIFGEVLFVELVHAAVLYLATVLGLKKGLNLA